MTKRKDGVGSCDETKSEEIRPGCAVGEVRGRSGRRIISGRCADVSLGRRWEREHGPLGARARCEPCARRSRTVCTRCTYAHASAHAHTRTQARTLTSGRGGNEGSQVVPVLGVDIDAVVKVLLHHLFVAIRGRGDEARARRLHDLDVLTRSELKGHGRVTVVALAHLRLFLVSRQAVLRLNCLKQTGGYVGGEGGRCRGRGLEGAWRYRAGVRSCRGGGCNAVAKFF